MNSLQALVYKWFDKDHVPVGLRSTTGLMRNVKGSNPDLSATFYHFSLPRNVEVRYIDMWFGALPIEMSENILKGYHRETMLLTKFRYLRKDKSVM